MKKQVLVRERFGRESVIRERWGRDILGKELQETTLLPEYGRKRLLTYADSFMQLAKSFYGLAKEEYGQEQPDEQGRVDMLMQKRLMENRELLADHLYEMSRIMTGLATEAFRMEPAGEKDRYRIGRELKRQGIYLHRLFCMTNEHGIMEVAATMRKRLLEPGEEEYSVADIAGLLSVILKVRLTPAAGSPMYLRDELDTVIFEEETRFSVMPGVARAVKEGENMSGDNYTFCDLSQGRFAAVLSDGMGSGEKACRGSEMVVELFEQFLESGFSPDGAAQMINGALMASVEETNVSTLDACYFDLYHGTCSFTKVGASATYIKKDGVIEKVEAGSLPLGVLGQLESTHESRELTHGEYVIMLSDGVADCFARPGGEVIFEDMLACMTLQEPNEMAAAILRQAIFHSNGKIADDMTVLVTGVWETD